MKAIIHHDGGARPTNAGHAGFAVKVELDDVDSHPLIYSAYIGWKTNNEAEYTGLAMGLHLAALKQADEVMIYTDSKLIYGQLTLGWQVKAETLKPLFKEVTDLLEQHFVDSWKIRWISREENSECDALCTKAILAGMKASNPFTMKAIGNKSVDQSLVGVLNLGQ